MIRLLKFISILNILLFNFSLSPAFAQQFKATKVSDGDENQENIVKVRLVGIDAPETSKKNAPGQQFSQKSTKHLDSLVLNKMVEIKSYGKDRYGRTFGVVFVDGQNANLEMVKAGLAEVYRGKNVKGLDMEPFWNTEEEAREAGVGMWSLGEKYISPREWRQRGKN